MSKRRRSEGKKARQATKPSAAARVGRLNGLRALPGRDGQNPPLEQGPDGGPGIAPTDLLPLGSGAGLVTDRHLHNGYAEAAQLGSHLGTQLEPAGPQLQGL